jgi:hypothetical protein
MPQETELVLRQRIPQEVHRRGRFLRTIRVLVPGESGEQEHALVRRHRRVELIRPEFLALRGLPGVLDHELDSGSRSLRLLRGYLPTEGTRGCCGHRVLQSVLRKE